MSSTASLLVLALAGLLLVTFPGLCAGTAAAHHRPNGNQCHPSGSLEGPSTGHICGECCKPGHLYPKYQCSPPVTKNTRAVMTLNNFEEGGDGGDPSECDGKYHYNTERVVALSTGGTTTAGVAARTYGSAPRAGPCSPRSWMSATACTVVTSRTPSSRRASPTLSTRPGPCGMRWTSPGMRLATTLSPGRTHDQYLVSGQTVSSLSMNYCVRPLS